ncbi:PH domain-containing protein [Antrihabitans sp. YC2-6]|nr:PH domain-containing protein [Antrihabitans sp. YC2-6]
MIRFPRLGLLGAAMLLFCVSFPVLGWPALFGWLLLVPIVAAVWVVRTRTVVTDDGLDLRTLFGKRHLDWTEIKGLRIPKRGWARADLVEGGEVPLPAVSFDRLRDLAQASGGRIPDPFAAAPTAVAPEKDSEADTDRG